VNTYLCAKIKVVKCIVVCQFRRTTPGCITKIPISSGSFGLRYACSHTTESQYPYKNNSDEEHHIHRELSQAIVREEITGRR
jgi:hypothetical protein